MAFLGGLPGILAAGTTAGLGTAEQQRARQDAIMRFGLNLAQQQAELAERKRQHDMQYELLDMTPGLNILREQAGQPPLDPGSVKMPRERASGFQSAYASMLKEPPVTVEEIRRQMKGLGLDVPDLPSETIQAPGEAGRPAEDIIGMPTIRQPTAESRAILGTRVPRADIPLLRGSLAERSKANREATLAEGKAKAIESVKGQTAAGKSLEEALRLVPESSRYPDIDWERVIYGGRLAAPEKPDKPKDVVDPRTGEITRINPDGTWKTVKPGTPDEGKTLDIEYKKLRNEKALLDKSTADLIDALRTGKPVDFKQARLAQGQYTTTGQKLILAADALPANHPDKVSIVESGAQSLKTAAEIGRHMEQRGKTGGKKETLSRKDPRYQKARERGLSDQDIEQRFNLQLGD